MVVVAADHVDVVITDMMAPVCSSSTRYRGALLLNLANMKQIAGHPRPAAPWGCSRRASLTRLEGAPFIEGVSPLKRVADEKLRESYLIANLSRKAIAQRLFSAQQSHKPHVAHRRILFSVAPPPAEAIAERLASSPPSSLALAARLAARPVLVPFQVEEERALERERYVRVPDHR